MTLVTPTRITHTQSNLIQDRLGQKRALQTGASQVRFGGFEQVFGAFLNPTGLTGIQKGILKLIAKKEGAHGLSHELFVKDTLVSYLPKVTSSRSWPDFTEATIQEIAESVFVYYSITLSAKWLFQHAYHALLPKSLKFDKALLQQPVSAIKHLDQAKSILPVILPVKAAILLSSLFAVAMCGEYALTFFKTLSTVKLFKREKFSEVVSLEASSQISEEKSKVAHKAKKRIAQSLERSLATLLLCSAMVLIAPRFPKSQTFFRKLLDDFSIEKWPNWLREVTKHLRLSDGNKFFGLDVIDAVGDGPNAIHMFKMKNIHNWFFIANAFTAYLDACREKLETIEVGSRLVIVMGFLLGFGDVLAAKIHQWFGHKFYPDALEADGRSLKTLSKVWEEAPEALKNWNIGQTLDFSAEPIQAFIKTRLKPLAKGYFMPQLFIIALFALANNLNGRWWTAYRFKKAKAEKQTKASQVQLIQATPLTRQMPVTPVPFSKPNMPVFSPTFALQQPVRSPWVSVPNAWNTVPVFNTQQGFYRAPQAQR